VLGIREAFDAADTVRLPGDVPVRVPTIPGLALLKVIAWVDRRLLSRRDAVDLDEILGWYADGLSLDDLSDDTDLLARYDFDLALTATRRDGAGARRPGPAGAPQRVGGVSKASRARARRLPPRH
jgi:predicted nucleotidyltransferase